MPVWWGRKSSKSKDDQQLNPYGTYQQSLAKLGNKKDKSRSFDEVGGGFSDGGAEKKGHPLPRPSDSSIQGLGMGLRSGSVSVSSSVSSSGSSDDHGQFWLGGDRGNGDMKLNPMARNLCTSSRPATSPSSPLHPRLDSPKQDDGRSQLHPLPLPPGSPKTLSKWKKGKLLGRGSFGHVYVGFNSEGGQMCAIKEVKVVSDDQASKECLKQLNQEINLLSRLSHHNIVRYHGSELGEETLSVYLEYVSGGSIHKLLQDYGAFKEPVIQNYTRQILCGLAYLHGRNTVHRDIKGANILVGPNGEVKLADFGMAKHITNCCSMLSFKGSPYWMAPEVVMNTNGYNLAVDIWSLGCTVLEMASAKPPWSQFEGVAAIFKIGNSRDIPEIPDNLSNDAKSFVKLCLQRDPLDRPAASQLLEHPFIRDQTTTRVANVNISKDAFPYAFDGSRTSPTLELRSNRMTLCEIDYTRKPAATTSTRRENVRAMTSLPVSPCSSPLRHYRAGHMSGFLSPAHPTFGSAGQNSYSPTSFYAVDPFQDASLRIAQTPGASPRIII